MLLTLQLTLLAVGAAGSCSASLTRRGCLSSGRSHWLGWIEEIRQFLALDAADLGNFWFYALVPKLIRRPVSGFYSVLIAFVMFGGGVLFRKLFAPAFQCAAELQISAAMALGLTNLQSMRYVVLPQAVRNMIPVLLTQSIIMLQDTSLGVRRRSARFSHRG